MLRLLRALYSLPFQPIRDGRAGGGLPPCGKPALTASAELRTLHVLEAHWLRFPELIKTLMATWSLMQKNRCFIIDYSAKTMIKIRIASPQALLELKSTSEFASWWHCITHRSHDSMRIAHSQSTVFSHSCFGILPDFGNLGDTVTGTLKVIKMNSLVECDKQRCTFV